MIMCSRVEHVFRNSSSRAQIYKGFKETNGRLCSDRMFTDGSGQLEQGICWYLLSGLAGFQNVSCVESFKPMWVHSIYLDPKVKLHGIHLGPWTYIISLHEL